jgi:hypothetical protein
MKNEKEVMNDYFVWSPERGETQLSCIEIQAFDPIGAAIRFARRCGAPQGPRNAEVLFVRDIYRAEPIRVSIHTDSELGYFAEQVLI